MKIPPPEIPEPSPSRPRSSRDPSRMNVNGRTAFEGLARVRAMPVVGQRRERPQEGVARVDGCEVYTPVGTRAAEIVVPVRRVERVAALEVLNPRHIPELELVVRDRGVH